MEKERDQQLGLKVQFDKDSSLEPMRTRLRFLLPDGAAAEPAFWLSEWARRYPYSKYPPINDLLARSSALSAKDFVYIGRWKDGALNPGKWKPNVASVAYPIWLLAAAELPGQRVAEDDATTFLFHWSTTTYDEINGAGAERTKRFGLARATTLLHLMTGGRFPIFDSRVRRAVRRLTDADAPNSIEWYLQDYRSLFRDLTVLCKTEDVRQLDAALFMYGGRKIRLSA